MYLLYCVDNRGSENCNSGSGSLSSGAVAGITFVVTFIVSVTVTAIITFIVTYIYVKRIFKNTDNPNSQIPQEKRVYEEMSPSSHTKNDLELQPNPSYDKLTMDFTNPSYESHK